MNRPFLLAIALVASTSMGAPSVAVAGPVFVDLNFGPFATFDTAYGVSGDGSTAVGQAFTPSSQQEAFRWTQSTGMVGLGDLPGGPFFSQAQGVSADGSVVVGFSRVANRFPNSEAFRWTQSGGIVGLGDPASGFVNSNAFGVSADGSVIVGGGVRTNFLSEAFLWTESGGMVGLGDLPGGVFFSTALGVSGDGQVVVGQSRSANGAEAFRLVNGVMAGLGDLPGGGFRSLANATNADGSVVVGESDIDANGNVGAFIWRESTGSMVALGDLAGGSLFSRANDVNADGTVVVGSASSTLGAEAFVWDDTNGMRSIQGLLEAQGLDLGGWKLEEAYGVSDDGLTFVGQGTNPSGSQGAWYASLETPNNVVPEPSSLALLGIGAMGLIAARRRKSKNLAA